MDIKTYIASGARGRAAQLASALGISPSYLSQMANGGSAISPERCVAIEIATLGEVSRKDLCPDNWQKIWPELVDTHLPATERRHDPQDAQRIRETAVPVMRGAPKEEGGK